MQFDVFDTDHPAWGDAVKRVSPALSDINFLPEWYKTWENHEQARAECIVAEFDGVLFIYPFFRKEIPGEVSGMVYYDLQTAYGYGGVITDTPNPPASAVKKFNDEVNDWLYDNRVIAEFIREHPLLDHCRRDADYVKVRTNVYVYPTKDYNILEKKTRQNVSKNLRNEEIHLIIDEKLKFLDDFVRLYRMNAERINMDVSYRFGDDYFDKIRLLLAENTRLIHVFYRDRIINSMLFFYYGNKGTMHLTGSDFDFQYLRGNDFLFYNAILLSANLGLEVVTMGGGTTNREDDSLFRFKSKFSNVFKDVMIGKKIINPGIYNRLVADWAAQYPELQEKYSHFFLRYRLNE